MREHRREFRIFSRSSLFDSAAIREQAERMAAQGWLVEGISGFSWRYRRIEPRPLHFSVVYLAGYTAYDPDNDAEKQDFLEYCSQDGWRLAAWWKSMHLFYNESPAPVPIETDPLTQYRCVRNALLWGVILPEAYVLFASFSSRRFRRTLTLTPAQHLADPSFFWLVIWIFCSILLLADLFSAFAWIYRAGKAARQGIFLERKTSRLGKLAFCFCYAILFFLVAVYLTAALGLAGTAVLSGGLLLIILFLSFWQGRMRKAGVSCWQNLGRSFGLGLLLILLLFGMIIPAIL